ncbi:OmpA family protein [Aliiroseovarius sp. KMU-50]|uniref:OmpA family protein n=1 Tax=Aliiroseovarius salicola TaxID=3009082 RepID=A0ABT4VZ80_9RHOB|nr:OmpA family protein [Aliiroseovarius sp. KMU-50]MDA5093552.1 OmpA family protein [Aliiroseovarius sp. KMU-50]
MQTKPLLILGTVAIMTATACTSPTGELGPRTKDGAVAGAMLGGVIGALSRDRGKLKGAAVGAAIGAGLGGAIGASLDKQARELDAAMGNDQVRIVNTGESLVVTMPQDILFATDSSVVNYGLHSDLAALARNLQNYPNSNVEVIGHTDNVGDANYNLSLSRQRAASVAAVLFQNGVPSSRVITVGRGEHSPVASNLTPEGRQQNRRVEIIIRPYT